MATWMFELYYHPPADLKLEAELTSIVVAAGGGLDYREAPEVDGSSYVCLTYEFGGFDVAKRIHDQMWRRGHHVEGVALYT